MEKYYLVKTVCVATAANHSFGGEIHTYYHGKNDQLMWSDGNAYINCDLMQPRLLREYGYKTENAAKRNWSYKNPENTEYWKSTSEIISVEIHSIGNSEYLV